MKEFWQIRFILDIPTRSYLSCMIHQEGRLFLEIIINVTN